MHLFELFLTAVRAFYSHIKLRWSKENFYDLIIVYFCNENETSNNSSSYFVT